MVAPLAPGVEVDLEAVVGRLGHGELLTALPRRPRRRWGPVVQLVLDRSEHLVPYWNDQDQVGARLARLLPSRRIEQAVFYEGLRMPRLLDETGRLLPYRAPAAGSVVLVLGDGGALASTIAEPGGPWLLLGRRLQAAGCRAVLLMPGPPELVPPSLRSVWHVIPWEGPHRSTLTSTSERARRAARLLRLISPAVRIEPGFLRAVRLRLMRDGSDAGTEAEVWQHPVVTSTSSEAATLDVEAAKVLRDQFAREPVADQEAVLELLRSWRAGLPDEIWFEEVLSLAPTTRAALSHPADIEAAEAFFDFLETCRTTGDLEDAGPGAGAWLSRAGTRATRSAWAHPSFRRAAWSIKRRDPSFTPPVDPLDLDQPGEPERTLALVQRGSRLVVLARGAAGASGGSPLGLLPSTNGILSLDEVTGARPDPGLFWAAGTAPSWADDWGDDGQGKWASFSIEAPDGTTVSQRMRWIPPGRFLMGSPETEPGRWDDEGPRHEVTIGDGFWLFDTACTQALWQAVMGEQPEPVQGSGPAGRERELERRSGSSSADQRAGSRAGPGAAVGGAVGVRLPGGHGDRLQLRFETITPEQARNYRRAKGDRAGGEPARQPLGSLRDARQRLGMVRRTTGTSSYEGAPSDGSAWLDLRLAPRGRVLRGGSWLTTRGRPRGLPAQARARRPQRQPRFSLCPSSGERGGRGAGGSGDGTGGGAPSRVRPAEATRRRRGWRPGLGRRRCSCRDPAGFGFAATGRSWS